MKNSIKSKNLMILRVGKETSLPWLESLEDKNFDLWLTMYDGSGSKYATLAGVDLLADLPGFKFHPLKPFLRERQDEISKYDVVAFPDDDLVAEIRSWNRLFDLCASQQFDLAQPAVTGKISHSYLAPEPGVKYRYVSFVEMMTPFISRRILRGIVDLFDISQSGWGLDGLWSHLYRYPEYKVAVIDDAPVHHSRPLGSGVYYENLRRQGVDCHADARRVMNDSISIRYEVYERIRQWPGI